MCVWVPMRIQSQCIQMLVYVTNADWSDALQRCNIQRLFQYREREAENTLYRLFLFMPRQHLSILPFCSRRSDKLRSTKITIWPRTVDAMWNNRVDERVLQCASSFRIVDTEELVESYAPLCHRKRVGRGKGRLVVERLFIRELRFLFECLVAPHDAQRVATTPEPRDIDCCPLQFIDR